MSVNAKMTAIADAIRDKTGGTEKLDLDAIADGVGEVYEAGKQAEHDRFWDAFQLDNKGKPRTDYSYAFYTASGVGWNAENFKPKYDLKPITANLMFYQFSSGRIDSLVEMLERAGITLDTSNCTNCNFMFYQSPITDVPHLDLTKCTNVTSMYCNCYYLKSAEITMAENKASTYNQMFHACQQLENLIVHGTLDKSFSLVHSSKLTDASVQSVIDALKDLTGATTQKVQFHTDVLLQVTDEQFAALAAKNWTV